MTTFVKRILLRDKMYTSRLGLAGGSMLWALQLALPINLFPSAEQLAKGTGRQTYAYMAQVMSEDMWAALFLIHALACLYSLRTSVRNRWTLIFDGILGCVLWTGSTALCYEAHWPKGLPWLEALQAYPPPAAMSGEAVLAFFAWWYMLKHWAEEPTARGCRVHSDFDVAHRHDLEIRSNH